MLEATALGIGLAPRLALAGLTGLAIGIEREWSGHASGPRARFGGVRTFLLLGLMGGIAGLLAAGGWVAIGAALIAGGALLAVLAYVVASQQTGDRDGTTEAAALLVLATAALRARITRPWGAASRPSPCWLCAEKGHIQAFVGKIGERELLAALRFAVLAIVVLPLLPLGPFGPARPYGRAPCGPSSSSSGLSFLGLPVPPGGGP